MAKLNINTQADSDILRTETSPLNEQSETEDSRKSVVVIGGGTGQPKVLRALLAHDIHPSAIVTMADDGGSSGRLREEMGIIPPGDVRNCLAALASPYKNVEAELLGYRFNAGEGLSGHALGNLIIAAFADITGSFETAVKLMERFLRIRGRVLPSTFEDVVLSGYDRKGKPIVGQRELAINEVAIDRVLLTPKDPEPNGEAIEAIRSADLIILAPGSLFTSLIPNLLVAGVCDTIRESSAQVIYLANVKNALGETTDMDPADYLEALIAHGLAGCIDEVLINQSPGSEINEEIEERILAFGVKPRYFDLMDQSNSLHHDIDKLSAALESYLQ